MIKGSKHTMEFSTKYENILPSFDLGKYTILGNEIESHYVIIEFLFEDMVHSYVIYKNKAFRQTVENLQENAEHSCRVSRRELEIEMVSTIENYIKRVSLDD